MRARAHTRHGQGCLHLGPAPGARSHPQRREAGDGDRGEGGGGGKIKVPEFGIKFNRVNKNLIKWEYIGKGAAPRSGLIIVFCPPFSE